MRKGIAVSGIGNLIIADMGVYFCGAKIDMAENFL